MGNPQLSRGQAAPERSNDRLCRTRPENEPKKASSACQRTCWRSGFLPGPQNSKINPQTDSRLPPPRAHGGGALLSAGSRHACAKRAAKNGTCENEKGKMGHAKPTQVRRLPGQSRLRCALHGCRAWAPERGRDTARTAGGRGRLRAGGWSRRAESRRCRARAPPASAYLC